MGRYEHIAFNICLVFIGLALAFVAFKALSIPHVRVELLDDCVVEYEQVWFGDWKETSRVCINED